MGIETQSTLKLRATARTVSSEIVLGVSLSFLSLSCSVFRTGAVLVRDAKSNVREAAISHMQYYVVGDVGGFVSAFAEDVKDMGGGPNQDGSIDLDQLRVKLEERFGSESFRAEYDDKTLPEILLIDSMAIFDHEAISAMGWMKRETFGYTVQPNDYLVRIPVTKNSPFHHDGFSAVYREIGGEWKIVVTD